MDYDLVIDHNMAKQIVNERGWDGFVLFIEQQFHYSFFSCSQDWHRDSKYICKLKGRKGDVIIGWIGIHAPARRPTVTISMGVGVHEIDAEDLENGKFTLVRTINPDITRD